MSAIKMPAASSAPKGARQADVDLPQLGRYTILDRLASGGMATVYVGRQGGAAGFERLVAIKLCHEHLRNNKTFASMFLEEARLAARVRHPNVVATLDVSAGDPLYLIMEYVEGESLSLLARRARRRGSHLPMEVSLRMMMDALAGLQAAHECVGPDGRPLGLVHCDISPQNILVGVDGTARITDFGIARAAAHLPEDGGVIKGKLAYMAPEQISAGPITQRADVFSAGVVLWELLTGEKLFRGDDDAAIIRAALHRPIPPPSALRPNISQSLDAIVLRAAQRDPARRFPSALEFLSALERLPLSLPSARAVGEYVRREMGDSTRPPQAESGTFGKRPVAGDSEDVDTPALPADRFRLPAPFAPVGVDPPTRVVDPPRELLAATGCEPSRSDVGNTGSRTPPPDAYRPRRLIVAFVLILVGCAAGLLLAPSRVSPSGSSSASPSAFPESAPSAGAAPTELPP
jgi:serine/threonine-protein kinase